MIYPIIYRTIPTQYAFLIDKTDEGYRVQVRPTQILTSQDFKTREEVDAFINHERVL